MVIILGFVALLIWLIRRDLAKISPAEGTVGGYNASGRLGTRNRSDKPTSKEYAVAETIFDIIDSDKSGTIDLTEMAKYLIEQGEQPSRVQSFFDKMDADGDGSITREEWKKGWAKGVIALHPPGSDASRQRTESP